VDKSAATTQASSTPAQSTAATPAASAQPVASTQDKTAPTGRFRLCFLICVVIVDRAALDGVVLREDWTAGGCPTSLSSLEPCERESERERECVCVHARERMRE
jgi:hypothetical protein